MKLIRNVMMASGTSFKTVNVLFDDTIQQIGPGAIQSDQITEEYDYSGCIIIPGAIDMHTHLLNGSAQDKQNLKQITELAAQGGYTTLADMSYATSKPILKAEDLKYYFHLLKGNSNCDIALWGHCDFSEFPYHLTSINELWTAGVVGFVIMQPSPNQRIENVTYEDIMDLFDTIYDSDISFAFQGYDEGDTSDKKNIRERFSEQRLSSIRKILRRMQDNPIHFLGIFDRESVEILNIAFKRTDLTYAMPIDDMMKFFYKFKETGITQSHPEGEYGKLLYDSMKNGRLYTLSTEAGFPLDSPNLISNQAYSGYNVDLLRWAVPWAFSELWKRNRVSVQSCIRLLCENPAKRLGLFPVKGSIQKGSQADITIIDPNKPVKTNLSDPNGERITLSCSVRATFLRGELYNNSAKGSVPRGQFIPRTTTTRRRSNSSNWN